MSCARAYVESASRKTLDAHLVYIRIIRVFFKTCHTAVRLISTWTENFSVSNYRIDAPPSGFNCTLE